MTITSLKFKFGWKIFEQSRFDVQSRNIETSKSSSGSYRYLTLRQTKAMMERKTRYEVQKLLVAEYETDGSMKFITGEDLELWYRDKIKGTVREVNLMKRYKKHLQESSLQGRF